MKVYFAAHATSKDNETGISSGWKDVELSELGKQQAKELGARFASIPLDMVCCSDLKRAIVGHRATQYGLDIFTHTKAIEECVSTPFKWQPYWEYEL